MRFLEGTEELPIKGMLYRESHLFRSHPYYFENDTDDS